jgi:hypothetical protein
MFPNGNIVLERSKFNENVPAWELLAARGLDARKFPTGHIAAKGKAAKTKCARSGTRSVVIPARRLNFQSEFEIKSSVARNKMARVPHPLRRARSQSPTGTRGSIWPMPSAEILRRMLQLGLSRAIIVYPGDAGAPNSNAHRPDQEPPAGNAGPLLICPRVQKAGA